MEVTQYHGEAPTNHFNQTMIVEETVTTSTTNSRHVDMSVVIGNSNKRKTIETTSVDTCTIDVTKSVKIRKMNDENLDPGMYNTILHHEDMKSASPEPTSLSESHVNPQTTQIFHHGNSDFDTSDVFLSQIKVLCERLASYLCVQLIFGFSTSDSCPTIQRIRTKLDHPKCSTKLPFPQWTFRLIIHP